MIPWLLAVLWDQSAARALLVWIAGVAGTFLLQPVGRPWWERLGWSVIAGLPGAVASLPSSAGKRGA